MKDEKCQWCEKYKNEENGRYDDAGNWECDKCFVEHNAK